MNDDVLIQYFNCQPSIMTHQCYVSCKALVVKLVMPLTFLFGLYLFIYLFELTFLLIKI